MPDRVDPVLQSMQPSYRQAMIDRVFSKPQGEELAPSHDPVLPPRQLPYLSISTARPSHPAYFAG